MTLLKGPVLTGIWETLFYLLFPIFPGKKSKAPILPTEPNGIVVEAVCLFFDFDFLAFVVFIDSELSSGGDLSLYSTILITFSFLLEFVIVLSLLWAIAMCAMWVALYFSLMKNLSFYFYLLLTDLISLEKELFLSSKGLS